MSEYSFLGVETVCGNLVARFDVIGWIPPRACVLSKASLEHRIANMKKDGRNTETEEMALAVLVDRENA